MTIEQSDAAPEKWKHSVRSQESDIWVCLLRLQNIPRFAVEQT